MINLKLEITELLFSWKREFSLYIPENVHFEANFNDIVFQKRAITQDFVSSGKSNFYLLV